MADGDVALLQSKAHGNSHVCADWIAIAVTGGRETPLPERVNRGLIEERKRFHDPNRLFDSPGLIDNNLQHHLSFDSAPPGNFRVAGHNCGKHTRGLDGILERTAARIAGADTIALRMRRATDFLHFDPRNFGRKFVRGNGRQPSQSNHLPRLWRHDSAGAGAETFRRT